MELWTAEHVKCQIPAMVAMVLIAILLKLTIGKKSHKIRMIPIQVIAVLLIVLEIGKQIVSFQAPGGYDLYSIPLHFCSLYLFSLPVMAFYRGKRQATVTAVTTTLCMGLVLFMLIYPNLIFPSVDVTNYFSNYMSFHTVTFHNLVVLATLLIFVLDIPFPVKKGEQRWVAVATAIFCLAAGSMAQIIKTNFSNFYSCNVPPVENIRLSMQGVLGYGLTQTIYVLILAALHILFMLGCYWLYRLVRRITCAKKPLAIN